MWYCCLRFSSRRLGGREANWLSSNQTTNHSRATTHIQASICMLRFRTPLLFPSAIWDSDNGTVSLWRQRRNYMTLEHKRQGPQMSRKPWKRSARVHFFRRKKADRPRAKPNSRNFILILWGRNSQLRELLLIQRWLYKVTSQQVF